MRLNVDFIEAFKKYCSSMRKTLLFPTGNATWDFETLFRNIYLKEDSKYKQLCEVAMIIENANHYIFIK